MENYSPEKILQPVEQIKPISESEASENVEVKKERNTIQKDLEEIKNILEILVSKL